MRLLILLLQIYIYNKTKDNLEVGSASKQTLLKGEEASINVNLDWNNIDNNDELIVKVHNKYSWAEDYGRSFVELETLPNSVVAEEGSFIYGDSDMKDGYVDIQDGKIVDIIFPTAVVKQNTMIDIQICKNDDPVVKLKEMASICEQNIPDGYNVEYSISDIGATLKVINSEGLIYNSFTYNYSGLLVARECYWDHMDQKFSFTYSNNKIACKLNGNLSVFCNVDYIIKTGSKSLDITWITYWGGRSITGHFEIYRIIDGQKTGDTIISSKEITASESSQNLTIDFDDQVQQTIEQAISENWTLELSFVQSK